MACYRSSALYLSGSLRSSNGVLFQCLVELTNGLLMNVVFPQIGLYRSLKKWSQNGSAVELFGKTIPLCESGAIFRLIIMFEKKRYL